MEYLINRFRELLEGYNYSFSLEKNNKNEYILNIFDLPAELDFKLLELSLPSYYTVQQGLRLSMAVNQNTIFKPIKINNKNCLNTTLTEDNYASIINKIDVVLREYTASKYKK